MQRLQLFADSLEVKFHHIKRYSLDGYWTIPSITLQHNVLWQVSVGTFAMQINDSEYEGGEGQVILLPAGSRLRCRAISDRIELISINFQAHIAFLAGRDWSELLGLPVITRDTSELAPMFVELLHISEQSEAGRGMLLKAGLLRLIAYLFMNRSGFADGAQPRSIVESTQDYRIQRILEYLMAHPCLLPEVGELATLAELSESHLRKLFLLHIGLTPLAYIHQWKVEQAKQLLAESDKRISEISYAIGFTDPNYFSRLFKSKTGQTPQRYRAQFRLWTPPSAP